MQLADELAACFVLVIMEPLKIDDTIGMFFIGISLSYLCVSYLQSIILLLITD